MVELIEGMKKRGDGEEVKKILGKKGVKETVEKSVRKGTALLTEKIGEL